MSERDESDDCEWLGVPQLAKWLRVPEQSVYRWNSTSTGPRYARIGRHVRYRRRDVERWIAAQYDGRVPAA